ncbi:hypothetical protein, partial [Mesomycoplasma ovipneumoniae]|uniref:hypothetical protein n=1 Tax=Mesomycoplasma ovipneumoniae TaxID=29562 RepID=UPI0030803DD7
FIPIKVIPEIVKDKVLKLKNILNSLEKSGFEILFLIILPRFFLFFQIFCVLTKFVIRLW